MEDNKSFFENELEIGEKIIWEDSPSVFSFIEFPTMDNILEFKMLYYTIVFIGIIMSGILESIPANYLIVIIVVIIFLLMMKLIRIKKSRYGYSNKRVFFSVWSWGKQRTNSIKFENIGKITTEEYNNQSGILHFLPKKAVDFNTIDLFSGKRRHYPTFELLENIGEVAESINAMVNKG